MKEKQKESVSQTSLSSSVFHLSSDAVGVQGARLVASEQANKLLNSQTGMTYQRAQSATVKGTVIGNGQMNAASFFGHNNVRPESAHNPPGFLESFNGIETGNTRGKFGHFLDSYLENTGRGLLAFLTSAFVHHFQAGYDRLADILTRFLKSGSLADASWNGRTLRDIARIFPFSHQDSESHGLTPSEPKYTTPYLVPQVSSSGARLSGGEAVELKDKSLKLKEKQKESVSQTSLSSSVFHLSSDAVGVQGARLSGVSDTEVRDERVEIRGIEENTNQSKPAQTANREPVTAKARMTDLNFTRFIQGINPKTGDTISVSLKPGEPSILSFERLNDHQVLVYVGKALFGIVDTKERIKDSTAQISVADLIGMWRSFNENFNKILSPELQRKPIEAYLYLDGYKDLPESLQESLTKSELMSLVARIANYQAVHLVGDMDITDKALQIIQSQRSLKKKETLFVTGSLMKYPDASQVHMLTKGYFLGHQEELRSGPNRLFVTLEDINYNEHDRTMDVIAFNPVLSLLDLVGAMDKLSTDDSGFSLAYDFFKSLTGFKITKDEFKGYLKGDPNLIQKFALPPALKAIDINLALRVWSMVVRMTAQAA